MSEVKITFDSPLVTPHDRPMKGDRRIVKMLPTGLPGGAAILAPCIYMSPYDIWDERLKENFRYCLLLVSPGPPKPEFHAVQIPSSAIHKFPEDVVSW